jgi:hypothetical protein
MQQDEGSFDEQIRHKMNLEIDALLHFEHNSVWWNLDTSESRSEIPEKFWNVVPDIGVEVLGRIAWEMKKYYTREN